MRQPLSDGQSLFPRPLARALALVVAELALERGRGSEPLYRLREDSRLAFGNDEELAALRLELRPGRAEYDFITADGHKLDSGDVRCEPGD